GNRTGCQRYEDREKISGHWVIISSLSRRNDYRTHTSPARGTHGSVLSENMCDVSVGRSQFCIHPQSPLEGETEVKGALPECHLSLHCYRSWGTLLNRYCIMYILPAHSKFLKVPDKPQIFYETQMTGLT
ncbi:mCG144890, partial [Mus musculus]